MNKNFENFELRMKYGECALKCFELDYRTDDATKVINFTSPEQEDEAQDYICQLRFIGITDEMEQQMKDMNNSYFKAKLLSKEQLNLLKEQYTKLAAKTFWAEDVEVNLSSEEIDYIKSLKLCAIDINIYNGIKMEINEG